MDAAAAAREQRVDMLNLSVGSSLDGSLEPDGSLQHFEQAAQDLQSPIGAVRQGAESALLQLRAPGLESAQHAIQTCREVLNSSAVPAAQFQAALAVRDVVMRDWHLLPQEALASLREEMLQTTIGRVLTPPGAVPFVRQQLLQLVALMYKRVWLTDDAEAVKEGLLGQVTQLLGAVEDAPQSLGLQLMLAVLNEFSFTRLTAVGMTWEFHLQSRFAFQQGSLLRFFGITVEWLRGWEAGGGDGGGSEGGEGAAAALEMTSVVLHWNFQSKEAAAAAPAAGSVWATEDTVKDEVLSPPPSWRPVLTGEGGLQLLNVLFSGTRRHRHNPHLTRHYREALLGLCRLGGGEIWESPQDRATWQQAAIGGTLGWLQGLTEPSASGDQVRDACALLLRLLNGGARAALCSWGEGGAEGARALGVVSQICVRACALHDENGAPYSSASDVRAAQEEWQQEGVLCALRLWASLLAGGGSGPGKMRDSMGMAGGMPAESAAVAAAVAENSPGIAAAYLAWRLSWAVAEAEEAEGEEVEDGWEEMQAEREAEDGMQGETRLAGRICQSCAAHSLPLLAQLLEATVAAANDPSGGAGMQLPAALDLNRFGLDAEAAAAARQEQLCSVVEVVAAALTGRPRLTGPIGRGGRTTVPAELATAASTSGAAPLIGLADALLTIAEAIMAGPSPSPFTVETLVEALRAVCHSYCGVVPGATASHGLPPALLEELAPPTHAHAGAGVARRLERCIGVALSCIGAFSQEPAVGRASTRLLLTLAHTPPLRQYLLQQSANWVALHATACAATTADSPIGKLAPGQLRCVVEAVCRAGLSTHSEEGLAGSQQGAAYYSGIDSAFGGALVNLVAEPPHSWKASGDLPDSIVLRLRWAVCGLRGVAAAASEAPTAVSVYRERLAPALPHLPGLLASLLGPIGGKPTDECAQHLITTQQLFKLLSTVAAQPLPYLSAKQSAPFYEVVVGCLSVVSQHAGLPPFSEGGGDERPKVVTALLTLLGKLTMKCFVDFGEDDTEEGSGDASERVMDAVFTCVGFVLPLVSVELLTGAQKLHDAFFELVPFLVENFPLRTAALPAGLFTSIMQSLGYGLSSTGAAGASTTARSCLVRAQAPHAP